MSAENLEQLLRDTSEGLTDLCRRLGDYLENWVLRVVAMYHNGMLTEDEVLACCRRLMSDMSTVQTRESMRFRRAMMDKLHVDPATRQDLNDMVANRLADELTQLHQQGSMVLLSVPWDGLQEDQRTGPMATLDKLRFCYEFWPELRAEGRSVEAVFDRLLADWELGNLVTAQASEHGLARPKEAQLRIEVHLANVRSPSELWAEFRRLFLEPSPAQTLLKVFILQEGRVLTLPTPYALRTYEAVDDHGFVSVASLVMASQEVIDVPA